MRLIITCCLLISSVVLSQEQEPGLQSCLEKDSISCIQLTLFRQAKTFFDKPKIDLFGGIALVKNEDEISRHGKSIEDNTIAIEKAPTVSARNSEMETYFWDKVVNFLQQRSLSFNFANAARSISNAIPDDVKSDIKDVVEGRLSKRRIMRKLMPIMMGLAAKFMLLKVASLFGILFIAKKALVISVIALAVAVFGGAGSLIGAGAGGGGGGGGYGGSSGGGIFSTLGGLLGGGGKGNLVGGGIGGGGGDYSSGGWSSGGGGGGWDSAGAYSSPVGQSIAYSGYKQTRR